MSENFVENVPVAEAELPEAGLPVGDVASILAVDDSKTEWVEVPEWGCKVQLKSLTKAQAVRLRRQATDHKSRLDETKLEALLLVTGIVQPSFTPEHVDRLMEKTTGVLDRLLMRIMEISGMTDEVEKKAEADF